MLLTTRQVAHVKQTKHNNCVAACLAMVTGKDIEVVEEELLEAGFEAPYTQEAYVPYLVRNNIFPEKLSYTMHGPLPNDTVYLMSCSSKVTPGCWHMIVGVLHQGHMMIKDPADNFKEEQIYSDHDFLDGSIPVFEYLALIDCEIHDDD